MGKVWVKQMKTAAGSWGCCRAGELREVDSAVMESEVAKGPFAAFRVATRAEVRAWRGAEGDSTPGAGRRAVEKATAVPEVETADAPPVEAPTRRRRRAAAAAEE